MNLIDFEYNGELLSEHECIIGYVSDDNSSNISLGNNLKLNTVKNMDISLLVNSEYPDVIQKTFTIVKNPCGNLDNPFFTESEVESIMKWLNRKEYHKFKPIYSDPEYVDTYFMGTFTRVEGVLIRGEICGFALTLETNAPYGFVDDGFSCTVGDSIIRRIKTDFTTITGYIEADALIWEGKDSENLAKEVGGIITPTGAVYEPNYVFRSIPVEEDSFYPIGALFGYGGDIRILDYYNLGEGKEYYLVQVEFRPTNSNTTIFPIGGVPQNDKKIHESIRLKWGYNKTARNPSFAIWFPVDSLDLTPKENITLYSDTKLENAIKTYTPNEFKELINENNILSVNCTPGGLVYIIQSNPSYYYYCDLISFVSIFPSYYFSIPIYFEEEIPIPSDTFQVYNNSQELGYLYLDKIEMKCLNDGDIYLSNITDDSGEITIIKNCKKNEIITIDSKNKVITSSINHEKLYNDFNYVYPRLITNYNEDYNIFKLDLEEITGVEVNIEFSSVRKVGVMI